MRKNLPLILSEKRRNNSHIFWLEKLGFQFEPELVIPPFKTVIENYNRMTEKTARKLTPVQTFRLRGQVIPVPYGENPPLGAILEKDLLSDKEYISLLSQGFFPIGESINILRNGAHSNLEHDLAHLTGFLEDPAYAESLVEGAKALSKAIENQDIKLDHKGGSILSNYLFRASEGALQIPKELLPEILKRFQLTPYASDGFSNNSIESVRKGLKDYANDEFWKKFQEAYDYLKGHAQFRGGAARDIFYMSSAKEIDYERQTVLKEGKYDKFSLFNWFDLSTALLASRKDRRLAETVFAGLELGLAKAATRTAVEEVGDQFLQAITRCRK